MPRSRDVDGTGSLHIVRHAMAGDRRHWEEPDDERPLTAAGRAQAESIADRYRSAPPSRIVSSPARRCMETVQPLAQRCGGSVEPVEYLREGADPAAALQRLVGQLGLGPLVVACTHGDVLDGVAGRLLSSGVPFEGHVRAPKAVTFQLEVRGGEVASARVIPPPG